jgi:hypothetical protein
VLQDFIRAFTKIAPDSPGIDVSCATVSAY